MITCDCPVCTSDDPNNNRLRSSILLRNEEKTILVDCGSDYRQQALRYRINRLDTVLLTHAHSDHVSGIDELRLYNWKQKHPIPVFGSRFTLDDVRRRFDYAFNPIQNGGGVPQLDLIPVEGAFDAAGFRVLPLLAYHGSLPILGFRFGDFAYITDASFLPPATLEAIRGVRYLILNALRHRPHPTHFTVEQATAIAREIGAEHTWFTHITHDLDHATTNRELPEGIDLAHDGLEFDIEVEHA